MVGMKKLKELKQSILGMALTFLVIVLILIASINDKIDSWIKSVCPFLVHKDNSIITDAISNLFKQVIDKDIEEVELLLSVYGLEGVKEQEFDRGKDTYNIKYLTDNIEDIFNQYLSDHKKILRTKIDGDNITLHWKMTHFVSKPDAVKKERIRW